MNPDEWIKIKDLFNASVELSVSKRQEFLSEVDHDTRIQVERLIDAHKTADDFIDEPAVVDLGLVEHDPPDPHIGQQIDRYKIVSEVGQGGMGTVYLANRADVSFDKPVAIKLIKRGMDTNAVLKRFMMERQILAQLQNPNIANLIDGGTTADGLPYFVMEYVEGMPVTKYCSEHQLSVNERLLLFRKICSPVSYAHQNLVIHRDLKPSNIIVTEDGTPKLLDFGIAKLLHPDWSLDTDEATATMFRVMTPEYASPEQVRGLPITTASDVYSLSVVLYELLCGERPLKIAGRPADEAAQIVLAEVPPKPSSVISGRSTLGGSTKTNSLDEAAIQNPRSLRGDLDNIVMKGLAKEPGRRYQSVQEFSEDIRRHLEGLPVTATADSLSYRIDKFVGRHRTAVVAACLIFVTLAAATVLTSWQYIVARRERDKAEQRFAQVRKLTHTILFEYHDEIVKLPGSTPLLEQMVNNTLEYLDNLEVGSSGDIDLENEIAAAYQKVGDVQGNPYRGNLGNFEGALDSYRKSLAIREKLVREDPANPDLRRNLAKSFESIGDMFWTKGDFTEAVNAYRENLRIHSELSESSVGTPDDSYGIGRARHRIGQALSRSGDPEGALESFRMGLAKFQEISERSPGEKRYQLGKGSVLLKIGDMLTAQEDLQKAIENHREALRIWSSVAAAEPLDSSLKRNTAIASERVAIDLKQMNQLPEALETMKRAIQIQQEIADADPKNVQFNSEIGLFYVELGSIEGKLKSLSRAREHVEKGLAILKHFNEASPQWIDLRRDLALAYIMAGDAFSESGNSAEAAPAYRKSAELLETAPLRAELRGRLAQNYMNLGDAERSAGHMPDACTSYERSLDVVAELKREGKMSDTFHLESLTDKMAKCDAAPARPA